jgi:hypothetical protein
MKFSGLDSSRMNLFIPSRERNHCRRPDVHNLVVVGGLPFLVIYAQISYDFRSDKMSKPRATADVGADKKIEVELQPMPLALPNDGLL